MAPGRIGDEGEAERDVGRHEFQLTLVRALVAASWSDGSMAVEERDALSHLIDSVARTEAERDRLRRQALQDLDRPTVLEDVARLPARQRREVFDRVVDMLRRDHRVGTAERRFLASLRRRCGVGFWEYRWLAVRLLSPTRRSLAVVGAMVLAAAVGVLWLGGGGGAAPPVEMTVHPALVLPAYDPAAPVLDPEALYQRVRRSAVTVSVLVDGGTVASGSGVVIGADTGHTYYVLTNRHVVYAEVAGGHQLGYDIEFENGARFHGQLDSYSRRYDLALLAVLGVPLWAEPVAMRPSSELRVGQPVYALGSPLGLRHTFTAGVISALRPDMIQTDATVTSGSSGGPLFDAHGFLCGVVTAAHRTKDLAFAVYADTVLEMLHDRAQGSSAAGGG